MELKSCVAFKMGKVIFIILNVCGIDNKLNSNLHTCTLHISIERERHYMWKVSLYINRVQEPYINLVQWLNAYFTNNLANQYLKINSIVGIFYPQYLKVYFYISLVLAFILCLAITRAELIDY